MGSQARLSLGATPAAQSPNDGRSIPLSVSKSPDIFALFPDTSLKWAVPLATDTAGKPRELRRRIAATGKMNFVALTKVQGTTLA